MSLDLTHCTGVMHSSNALGYPALAKDANACWHERGRTLQGVGGIIKLLDQTHAALLQAGRVGIWLKVLCTG